MYEKWTICVLYSLPCRYSGDDFVVLVTQHYKVDKDSKRETRQVANCCWRVVCQTAKFSHT